MCNLRLTIARSLCRLAQGSDSSRQYLTVEICNGKELGRGLKNIQKLDWSLLDAGLQGPTAVEILNDKPGSADGLDNCKAALLFAVGSNRYCKLLGMIQWIEETLPHFVLFGVESPFR